ncbi:unnamed protein product [Ostreobium quekettii]|uniref:RAP domain-containing protein n=1 Tax=Ostreobium quekettii TaxID=121088 RepID=A0A8S1IQC8_9CHLO|nr:unnamed protein product [Ostreobium quekettii]|eukprot:evm.model.scf_65.19 EVM.evm.TU.scf_65.19   scf_65:138073-141563(-)
MGQWARCWERLAANQRRRLVETWQSSGGRLPTITVSLGLRRLTQVMLPLRTGHKDLAPWAHSVHVDRLKAALSSGHFAPTKHFSACEKPASWPTTEQHDVHEVQMDKWEGWLARRDARLERASRRGFKLAVQQMDVLSRSGGLEVEMQAAFRDHAQKLSEFAHQVDTFGLASLFLSCRRVGYVNSPVLQKVTKEAEARGLIKLLTPRRLSGIMHSLGVLTRAHNRNATWGNIARSGQTGLFDGIDHFATSILAECVKEENLSSFTEWSLACVVYGASLLDMANNASQRPRLDSAVTSILTEAKHPERLKKFKEQELVMIMYAMSRLGAKRPMVHLFCHEIVKTGRLPKYEAQNLSTILYSLGVLGHKDEVPIAWLMGETMKPHRLAQLKEEGLSNIVYALALLGAGNQAVLSALCDEIMTRHRLVKFRCQEVATLVWGLGKLGYFDPKVLRALIHEALKAHRLRKYTEQGIVMILYGLASVARQLGSSFAREELAQAVAILVIEAKSSRRRGECSQQNLGIIGWSIATLGFRDLICLKMVLARYMALGVNDPQQEKSLFMLLHACGTLRFKDRRFNELVAKWVDESHQSFRRVGDVAKLLHDLTLVGCLSAELFYTLFFDIHKLWNQGQSPTEQVWGWLFVPVIHMRTYRGDLVSGAVWERVMAKARRGWILRRQTDAHLRGQVSTTLSSLGVSHRCGTTVMDGAMPVDIELHPKLGKVVVEVDSALDYACNETKKGHEALGVAQWRNGILESCGWQVCGISPFEWNSRSEADRISWLRDQLESKGVPLSVDATVASE